MWPPSALVLLALTCASALAPSPAYEKRLLRGVLSEASNAQERKRNALEQQLDQRVSAAVLDDSDAAAKAHAKALRRAEEVPRRLAEVDTFEARLSSLQATLSAREPDLASIRHEMEEAGLGGRLQSFDVDAMALSQWGRADGFDGLVIQSPRGIPILVARPAFSDALLRRIARGSDLIFQVREGKGSRVLLRTSMCRQLSKSPRECMEAAADLAAHFSDARRFASSDGVEVIYTDPRHVAKRGGRVGQLKAGKRLGTLWAQPWRVADEAHEAQEEQGWL